jgi:hypothetical protein
MLGATPARLFRAVPLENKNVIVSRGSFLRVCGAALVGASLPQWSPGTKPPAPALSTSLGEGAASFSPHVGSLFTIEETGQRLQLRDVAESAISPGIEQFALHFTAPAETSIMHGTYTFRHAALGRIEMFITPVGAPAHGPLYQACFSRIVRAKEESWPINL